MYEESASSAAVWPPPPNVTPNVTTPFKNIHLTEAGKFSVSDYRVGNLSVHDGGITISGNAVQPAELQYWVLVGVFFVRLWLLIAILFEYIRSPRNSALRWEEIDNVVLDPNRGRVGIAYQEVNKKGVVKHYVLATKLLPADYEAFTTAVRSTGRATIIEGPSRTLRIAFGSPVGYSLLTGWLITACVFALISEFGFMRGH